ncbi:MAG: hypothetical protein IT359_20935 [Gemmatimonadaceae bacterium]|nr:hypothetical protein [Gemmatimonadaceae bacterium]
MSPQPQSSPLIAGSVLPIKRAEELLATLPGVIAARIIASDSGAVDEIHVLTTAEITPKQTVRNIESALIAHLGMRVDHRKISVATSLDQRRPKDARVEGAAGGAPAAGAAPAVAAPGAGGQLPGAMSAVGVASPAAGAVATPAAGQLAVGGEKSLRRPFYFEDVEVRRSRATGITCRVTLSKGEKSFIGEAEGMENERSRVELAARAALRAIVEGEPGVRPLDLGGAKLIEAFDREFVFVGVTVQQSRTSVLLTGSCEVKDSPETASVLAVLDATNRWLSRATAGA